MAKNTYKPASGPAPRATNEPRPARNQPRAEAAPAPAPGREPRRPAAPAAPKAPRKPLKLPNFGGALSFLQDRRFQLFAGFGFLIFSLFLTIAFFSYLFTGHADQSVVEGMGQTTVKEAGQETGNWLGLMGAWLSHKLIQQGFGIAAFALIPVAFAAGYKIVFRRQEVSLSFVSAVCLFAMLWLSMLLGYLVLTLQTPGTDPRAAHSLDFLCGRVGYEAALWLDSLIGWGTVLLLAFLLISFVVGFFNVTTINLPRRNAGLDDEDELEPATATQTGANRSTKAAAVAAEDEAEGEEDAESDLGFTVRNIGPVAEVPKPAAPAPAETKPAAGTKTAPARPSVALTVEGDDDGTPPWEVSPAASTGSVATAAASLAMGGLGTAASAATAPAVAAATTAAAALSAGPSFSIEAPTTEPVAAPTPRVSSVPTPLSLADLADNDAPLPAPTAPAVPAKGPSFEVEVAPEPELRIETTKPGELDPAAGADMAVISEEDEDAEQMPNVNYDPTLDLSRYQYPTLELLNDYGVPKAQVSKEELEANKDRIVETLGHYGINIASIKATIGPTVTLYEIVPDAGVRISKIKSLEDDIALSLAALGIRIIAPIPGKGTIGIEVPNTKKEMVSIRSVFATEKFANTEMDLPIAFGRTITNEVFVVDLAKMPHLLMAGATGQGKSVGLNVILASLLYKRHPAHLKFVLVDPKKVELSIFNKIERHFLAKLPDTEEPIITDTKKVVHTLNSLCMEMDRRYDLLKDAGCRNLKEYNRKFIERRLNPKKGHRFMPFIVLVIDELADLMMTAGKEVETPIARLAQLARAIGIHLIVATQRPSVNVITGIIKANFPCRISFKVTSKIDSRTILDAGGADQLVGQGDMLISQGSDIIRVQCAFIDTPEVDRLCDFVGEQQGYPDAYLLPEVAGADGDNSSADSDFDPTDRDSMFEEAARVIVLHQQGSTSLIQRKLKLGYNRAGRLIDQLEHAGIVGPFEGSKAREVLIPDEYALEQLLNTLPK
ncbi:FtsK/SpoIIIE family DNA translocase [Hymenobacter jeollabukensis]|uniref:DNA translocase FtsK n=1 Tax=Hymenobacter jeollabukensis TaxID=2025313 RepID=A0A5R8WW71_9BACT|nr:DNA translocase FtsK [Hymenobacter jeollabukensis]TLM96659.1 DNA translocase FtsK [Hymenobacter jeollabukensis]